MTLEELAGEFMAPRAPGWLVLSDAEVLPCALDALRFCAAHIAISSISRHDDDLPGASEPGTELPVQPSKAESLAPSLPVRELDLLDADTELTVGEWAIIRPLFALYVERENAMRLEASRALGLEVYGRMASEVTQDILSMERDVIPAAGFCHAIISID